MDINVTVYINATVSHVFRLRIRHKNMRNFKSVVTTLMDRKTTDNTDGACNAMKDCVNQLDCTNFCQILEMHSLNGEKQSKKYHAALYFSTFWHILPSVFKPFERRKIRSRLGLKLIWTALFEESKV